MAGEEDPDVPGSLAAKKTWVRLLVLSSGSLMNFLLPLLLFSIAFMVPYDTLIGQATVIDVIPDSPAGIAGISPGDTILSVNDKPVDSSNDVSRHLQLNLGKQISILIEHPDTTTETVYSHPAGDHLKVKALPECRLLLPMVPLSARASPSGRQYPRE